MNDLAENFLSWAQNPSRTLEERYGIFKMVEYVYSHCYRGADKKTTDWEEEQALREARKYNPAYQPHLDPSKLRIAAGLLEEVKQLRLDNSWDERPLRDLSFIAFLPMLEELHLSGLEMERIDGVEHLTKLRKVSIYGGEVEDYTPLTASRGLREIRIHTSHPWPLLTGFENLLELEDFHWDGNGRPLASIPCLPALKALHIDGKYHETTPGTSILDLLQLPEMPLLEYLWAGAFYRLDGIGRYPRLRFASIRGYFKNLELLTGLPCVSHLRINGPRLEEVGTVARMPSVQHFAVFSERPQDWTVLVESENLREVFHFGHDLPQPDLDTLQMLIPTWDGIFGLAEPRPLEPMRLLVKGEGWVPVKRRSSGTFPEGPPDWDRQFEMRESETWWARRLIYDALLDAGFLKLQGVRFELKAPDIYHLFSREPSEYPSRTVSLNILRSEAIGRMKGILECLRKALAHTRFGWRVRVFVRPEPHADDWDEGWRGSRNRSTAEEMEEEQRYYEHQRKRRQTYLMDEHRLRLLKEMGRDDEEFQPSPQPQFPESPPEPVKDAKSDNPGKNKDGENPEKKKEDKNDDDEDDDDDKEGGIAFGDPKTAEKDENWLEPVQISDPNHKWNNLRGTFVLSERGVEMASCMRNLTSMAQLLDLVPEPMPDDVAEDFED